MLGSLATMLGRSFLVGASWEAVWISSCTDLARPSEPKQLTWNSKKGPEGVPQGSRFLSDLDL